MTIAAFCVAGIPTNNAYGSSSDNSVPESNVAKVRVLPLEGGINFRDLGGYKTKDNRTIKWESIYRSGVMSNLTTADFEYLAKLNFQVVADLRNTEARTQKPALTEEWTRDYIAWDYKPGLIKDLNKFAKRDDATLEDAKELMTYIYSNIPYQFKDIYAEVFDNLIQGKTPLVFNCAAGKDRAGVMAALILTALGVPEETVVADYALSDDVENYTAKSKQELFYYLADNLNTTVDEKQGRQFIVGPYTFQNKLSPEVMRQMKSSDPEYIKATYAQLKSDYGSVLNFIQTELDVSDSELQILRNKLLE